MGRIVEAAQLPPPAASGEHSGDPGVRRMRDDWSRSTEHVADESVDDRPVGDDHDALTWVSGDEGVERVDSIAVIRRQAFLDPRLQYEPVGQNPGRVDRTAFRRAVQRVPPLVMKSIGQRVCLLPPSRSQPRVTRVGLSVPHEGEFHLADLRVLQRYRQITLELNY